MVITLVLDTMSASTSFAAAIELSYTYFNDHAKDCEFLVPYRSMIMPCISLGQRAPPKVTQGGVISISTEI